MGNAAVVLSLDLKRFAKNLNHSFSYNARNRPALHAFHLQLMPRIKGGTLLRNIYL